jgi:hypothetical protein
MQHRSVGAGHTRLNGRARRGRHAGRARRDRRVPLRPLGSVPSRGVAFCAQSAVGGARSPHERVDAAERHDVSRSSRTVSAPQCRRFSSTVGSTTNEAATSPEAAPLARSASARAAVRTPGRRPESSSGELSSRSSAERIAAPRSPAATPRSMPGGHTAVTTSTTAAIAASRIGRRPRSTV